MTLMTLKLINPLQDRANQHGLFLWVERRIAMASMMDLVGRNVKIGKSTITIKDGDKKVWAEQAEAYKKLEENGIPVIECRVL